MKKHSIWFEAIRSGLIGGAVSLLLCLVGMVVEFSDRQIIHSVLTMGQILVVAPIVILAYSVARRSAITRALTPFVGAVSGLSSGVVLAALVGIGQVINLRAMFLNASPDLYALLTFNLGFAAGVPVLLTASTLMGVIGTAFLLLPSRLRYALLQAFIWISLVGLLRDLISTILLTWGPIGTLFQWMFALTGLNLFGTIFLLAVIGGLAYWRYVDPLEKRAPTRLQSPQRQQWIRWGTLAAIALVLIFLPRVLGLFLSDVLDTVGLFILMGLGLNIVWGLPVCSIWDTWPFLPSELTRWVCSPRLS